MDGWMDGWMGCVWMGNNYYSMCYVLMAFDSGTGREGRRDRESLGGRGGVPSVADVGV